VSAFLLVVFYAAMAGAALLVEFLFGLLHLIPQQRNAQVMEEAIRWNYTSVLDIVFLVLAVLLLVRFFRTGGPEMLRMMGSSAGHDHAHAGHGHSHDQHRHHHDM
jgi:hypothetical protein